MYINRTLVKLNSFLYKIRCKSLQSQESLYHDTARYKIDNLTYILSNLSHNQAHIHFIISRWHINKISNCSHNMLENRVSLCVSNSFKISKVREREIERERDRKYVYICICMCVRNSERCVERVAQVIFLYTLNKE